MASFIILQSTTKYYTILTMYFRSNPVWSPQIRLCQIKSRKFESCYLASSYALRSTTTYYKLLKSPSGQVKSGQVKSSHVRSGQVRSGQVTSGQVKSGQVKSHQIRLFMHAWLRSLYYKVRLSTTQY